MNNARSHGERPWIGITVSVGGDEYRSRIAYARAVANAGAVPILLPCSTESIPEYLSCCDGFVTTGGDDPNMEAFGDTTHEKAKLIDPLRQEFEVALLRHLEETDHPLLAICLGMQLLTLCAGGKLDQFLPETLPTAELHWNGREHTIEGALGCGTVHSNHRQAMSDAGRLEIVARAPDGIIEAVQDPERPFRIGVQWHPERTDEETLGALLFEQLARAARA